MTRVVPNAMMFATVSGCAQTALVRVERSAAKVAAKTSGKSARRQSKGRSKRGRQAGKRS
jgi:hypothetical protein